MNGRTRRGAVALCVAFALVALGGVTVTEPAPGSSQGPSASSSTQPPGTTVVPGRYLVQAPTESRTELLRAIEASGATVDETYDTLWSGFSVTATDAQLAAIQEAAGTSAVYPVYRVTLDDPVARSQAQSTSKDSETAGDTSAPDAADAGDPSGGSTADPEGGEEESPSPSEPSSRAADDDLEAAYLTPTPLRVLANDSTDPARQPGSLVFVGPDPVAEGKQVVVDGGTFVIDATDQVTFLSDRGFSGDVAPVTYQVTYTDGVTATAVVSVHVPKPDAPAAPAVTATTTSADPVSIPLPTHADPESLLTLTACLPDAEGACADEATTAAGTWRVADDRITFTPAEGFTGTASVDYALTDEFGRRATGTLTVTVYAPPTDADRTATTPYLQPVQIDLANGSGEAGEPLDPASLVLIDPVSEAVVPVLEIAGEGTYRADGDGTVTFTPATGFTGPSAVGYQFSDSEGASVPGRLVITVTAPEEPTAADDEASGGSGRITRVTVRTNDTAHGGATLQPGSVCLVDGETCTRTLATDHGRWMAGPNGTVSFLANADYAGTVTTDYRIADELGRTGTATVTVVAHAVPVATDDTGHTAANNGDAGNHTDPINPLANDSAGKESVPLDPTSLTFTDAAATNDGHTLTTDDGTWQITITEATEEVPATGSVMFTPAKKVTGTTSTGYQVLDGNGTPASATITVTVGALPQADDDPGTTPQNVPVTVDPLTNDVGGDDGTGNASRDKLVPATLAITGTDPTTAGAWAVDPDGTVTFTPAKAFTGKAHATYRVADTLGNTATATITITVTAITPTASDDTGHTAANNSDAGNHAELNPLANDSAGKESVPLDPTSVTFTDDRATDDDRRLTTDDGTWQITITEATEDQPATATVKFTPADGFTGTTSTSYQVLDGNGTPALTEAGTSPTITITVGALPQAEPDTGSTKQNVLVTVHPLSNDLGGDDGTGNASSDKLLPDTLDITDSNPTDGAWTANADGTVTFAPAKTFTGNATADYRVTDSFGNTATATITITVSAITPTAADDTGHTAANNSTAGNHTELNPLANDKRGDPDDPATADLDPTSVTFTDAAATNDGRSLTTDDGTWQITITEATEDQPATATVEFTPADGFTGTTSTSYQVLDGNGTPALTEAGTSPTITITVGALPQAEPDTGSTKQNVLVTVHPLSNDLGGDDGTGNASSDKLLPDTLDITDSNPTDGAWTANADGTVTFAPAKTFTGNATADYRVTDSFGNTATATITITVSAITPTAADDTGHTAANNSTAGNHTELNPLANDKRGDPTDPATADLDPTSVTLTGSGTSTDGKTRTTTDGTWTVHRTTGWVTFTPAHGFTGNTSTTSYRVLDTNGTPALTEDQELPVITITVGALPQAEPDTGATKQNVPVTVQPLGNDSAGDDGAGVLGILDPSSVAITAENPATAGAWTANADGTVTFAPAKTFTGNATADYRVTDSFGNTATATITITVSAITPTAADDTGHTAANNSTAGNHTELNPLANDKRGDPTDPATADLDPTSVTLTGSGTSTDGKTRTTTDGTWTVHRTTGWVTFTPAHGFTGTTHTPYRVLDTNGTPALTAHGVLPVITITVGALTTASDIKKETRQNITLTIDPKASIAFGDDGGTGTSRKIATLRSVRFPKSTASDQKLLIAENEGLWQIDSDNRITFNPEAAFVGTATSVQYEVTDSFGNTATATITVTVIAITPIAKNDTGHSAANSNGTSNHTDPIDPLSNDTPGDADTAPLDHASLVLTGAGTSSTGRTRTTTAGIWTVNATTGAVTFTPADKVTGSTSTTYQVKDSNGTVATATITVTVGAFPRAGNDAASTKQHVAVTIDPLANDVGGDDGTGNATRAKLKPALVLTDATSAGTWQVDATTGTVTLAPSKTFTGKATATYRVTDKYGNTDTATITVTVTPIIPTAKDDPGNGPARHTVTVNPLANDSAGDPTAPLDPTTVVLTGAGTASNGKTRSTTAGTWAVNATTGVVTFTPTSSFTGTTSTTYQVRDRNGTLIKDQTKVITVVVGALPTAGADTRSIAQDGSTLSIDPVQNDTAGDNGTGARDSGRGFRAGSLVLVDSAAASDGKSLTATSYSWKVGSDNRISFTANWRFTGTVSAQYRVTDNYGNTTTARITVTVTPTAATDTERRLSAIGALDDSRDGSGINVGIIDSGINFQHPDLGGTSSSTFPTAKATKGWDYVDKDATPADCYGHGTHVAGIVAADGNPKLGGAYGVAPGVTLGAYRVFDCQGSATTDHILAALNRAYSDGMNVVSLSLGATGVSWPNETAYPLTQAAANLAKKGVVVVASAGNDDHGLFTVGSPAVAPGVISVAATTSTGTRTESYSAMGPAADLTLSPTIAAPGSGVRSTWLGTGWKVASGTSMAAPEVAGAVAALLQARGWTKPAAGIPARIEALLYASASPLASATSGLGDKSEAVFRQGAGLLQLQAALATTVTASPAKLSLGEGTSKTATITLTNSGSSAVTYQVSAVTGTSAAASKGKKTDVGNQTPDWAYGSVGFSASPASVTIAPRGIQKVTVKIKAPSKILKGRNGLLYGGWVRFTASGKQTVSVPFIGLRGDYQKVKMLPSSPRSFADASSGLSYSYSLPALAYKTSSGALQPTYSGTRTFRVAATNGQPYVMYHLDYPTSAIRMKAINTRTKKSYDAVLSGSSTQLGRQGRDDSYTLTPFYGIYKTSKGKLARVPAGTYKLQLRVLRPLGSSSKSAHWEAWTTRTLKISWS
jgi:CshA-type fibril repeat protein